MQREERHGRMTLRVNHNNPGCNWHKKHHGRERDDWEAGAFDGSIFGGHDVVGGYAAVKEASRKCDSFGNTQLSHTWG